MTAMYNDTLELITSPHQLTEAFTVRRKIGSMMGVEGGHMLHGSLAVLRMYAQLGVRYLTLTHSCHNEYADSATPSEPLHNGLSPRGHELLQELMRVGVMIDLAHVSHVVMRQVLRVSRVPVIWSHSSAYALCPNTRNVPDDVLLALKDGKVDGVVMVNFFDGYVVCSGVRADR